MADKLLKQADVIASIRKEHPELGEFNDNQILNKVLERRPDLIDKIENPMAGDVSAPQHQADHCVRDDGRGFVAGFCGAARGPAGNAEF